MNHHQHAYDGHRHDAADVDFGAIADLLDLDAEVLHTYLSDATGWVHDQAAGLTVARLIDLGCGTGPAAVELAGRWPAAEVVAVDGSAALLARLRAKAARLGLADRVHTVEADLDGPWPDTGAVDLVWTSMTLHHLADPGQALREIFARIRPGGLLAVAELTSSLRFLPDDIGIGRPGLEARCNAVFDETHAAALPHLDADWGAFMSQAGFADVVKRSFEIDVTAPLPAAAGRFAQWSLQRGREQFDGRLDAADLATLDAITSDDGPHSVLRRPDLVIRGARTLWTGRRP
ncbi:MAG TPA: class I SAM-dependent methyltransferase [Streptosporangiaceae bacterium]|jgi:SAM-dependent methyltransferase|nr:class I SAM-dependent methyltransferase [Streptosporangiaceae bacterium]